MSEPFVGEIRMVSWATNNNQAPIDWHICDGSLLPISQYQMLFSLLGTTYGGDGATTFALPDLRSRVPMGQGQGTGLTTRAIGQKIGAETVTVVDGQIPPHTHAFNVLTTPATSITPTPTQQVASPPFNLFITPSTTTSVAMSVAIGSAGANAPHYNVMPSFGVTYIIALLGLYPQRS